MSEKRRSSLFNFRKKSFDILTSKPKNSSNSISTVNLSANTIATNHLLSKKNSSPNMRMIQSGKLNNFHQNLDSFTRNSSRNSSGGTIYSNQSNLINVTALTSLRSTSLSSSSAKMNQIPANEQSIDSSFDEVSIKSCDIDLLNESENYYHNYHELVDSKLNCEVGSIRGFLSFNITDETFPLVELSLDDQDCWTSDYNDAILV